MIRKSDVQWWVLEAKKHPEAAPEIVAELAGRLAELDEENERLRDALVRLEGRAPAATDTAANAGEVTALREKVAALQSILDGTISSEPSLVLLSDRLQAARLPLAQLQRLSREERALPGGPGPRHALMIHPHEELLLLTTGGRCLKMAPADVPLLSEGNDRPATQGPALAEGERLTAAVTVGEPPRFWTVVTRRGFARQLIRIDLDRRAERGDPLIESPFRNDVPVALANGDRGDLLLITRWGKSIRFPQRAIESQGSAGLSLEPDDEIAAALPLISDLEILIVTAAGFAVRLDTARVEARSRPGSKGKTLIQAFDVLTAFPYDPQAQLLYLTYGGKLVFAATGDIPIYTRSGKGARVCTLDRDPAVAVVSIPGTA